MTIIAYRDGVLAADTVGWVQGVKLPCQPKVIRLQDGRLFAACGYAPDIIAWHNWLQAGEVGSAPTAREGFEALLVWSSGAAHHFDHTGCGYEIIAPFFATGAAAQFALGALFAGASAEQAVRLAIDHTDSAGGYVQAERINP